MNPNIYLMLLKLTSWVEREVAGCAIELTCKIMGSSKNSESVQRVRKKTTWWSPERSKCEKENYLMESWIEKIHHFAGEQEELQMGGLISLSVWFFQLVPELPFSSQLRECSPTKIGKLITFLQESWRQPSSSPSSLFRPSPHCQHRPCSSSFWPAVQVVFDFIKWEMLFIQYLHLQFSSCCHHPLILQKTHNIWLCIPPQQVPFFWVNISFGEYDHWQGPSLKSHHLRTNDPFFAMQGFILVTFNSNPKVLARVTDLSSNRLSLKILKASL